MSTSSSISTSEKKRLWEQYKYDTFQQISQDKSTLFNYFLENNDIFGMISENDEKAFKLVELQSQNQKSSVFFGSMAAVFFIDQVLLRFALPKFKIKNYRFTVNAFKYVLLPCISFTIYKDNFMDDYIYFFYKVQQKYGFGFEDYMKANRIFQRALAVDRLEELRQKRHEFDWTNVPQLVQKKK